MILLLKVQKTQCSLSVNTDVQISIMLLLNHSVITSAVRSLKSVIVFILEYQQAEFGFQ